MEPISFETSKMLAVFLASSPLLSESWNLCSRANTSAPGSFVTDQTTGGVGYLAFSGVQSVTGLDLSGTNLVPLDDQVSTKIFSSFSGCNDEEEPAMVHAGFLHIFLSMYHNPDFHNKMSTLTQTSKAVIVTGHSIGGTTASLAALWLLSCLVYHSPPPSVLCITFGSPLLGNESLSKSILRERWGGKFCHVVSKRDVVPRLLFAPLDSIIPLLNFLLQFWHLSMTSQQLLHLGNQLSDEAKTEFCQYVSSHVAAAAMADGEDPMRYCPYSPFGSYLLCSEEGAVCVENASAVVRMLHLMFTTDSANSSIDDHLKYGDVVLRISQQFLQRRSFTGGVLPEQCYEAGISMALEASGIVGQDSVAEQAKECLKIAKQMDHRPNLISAKLAIDLAKVVPFRAQIEWYKAICDDSDDQMGYYDSFKHRGASRRDSKVNMNRIKLGLFWDNVIQMLENNKLPLDFHKRAKWVNTSHFYKLLVEPLDIAEYYRTRKQTDGHYMTHGRKRRYEIFDRWWRDRNVSDKDNIKRSTFAGLTQDSHFWARVEEAREWMENARSEKDPGKVALLWENMNQFETYARQLVDSKKVSRDVVAKNSSYSLWVEEWKEFKSQLFQTPQQFPSSFANPAR